MLRIVIILLSLNYLLGCNSSISNSHSHENKNKIPVSNEEQNDSNRIISGFRMVQGSRFQRYTVGIINNANHSHCTGVIVDKMGILTAAHCAEVAPSDVVISFGVNLLSPTETRKVSQIIINKNYTHDESKDKGDLAYFKLTEPIPANYSPIAILQDADLITEGATLFIAGFGESIYGDYQSSLALRFRDVQLGDPDFSSTEFYLDQSQGPGICFGDSGGPAFMEIKPNSDSSTDSDFNSNSNSDSEAHSKTGIDINKNAMTKSSNTQFDSQLFLVGISSRVRGKCEGGIFTGPELIQEFINKNK